MSNRLLLREHVDSPETCRDYLFALAGQVMRGQLSLEAAKREGLAAVEDYVEREQTEHFNKGVKEGEESTRTEYENAEAFLDEYAPE